MCILNGVLIKLVSFSVICVYYVQVMFQLNKPAAFKQSSSTASVPSKVPPPVKQPVPRPVPRPPFAKKKVITQLPVAMDVQSSTANPYKYVADTSHSEKSLETDSNTTASTPPAVFDVNDLFKRTSSNSSSTSDVLSCKCAGC